MPSQFSALLIFYMSVTLLGYREVFAQWEIQESGVTTNLRDVSFVNYHLGWAVGDSATIIATTDGGKTWQKQICPIDTVIFEKVYFINKDVGYIIGRSGSIVSTKDGGKSWVVNESGVDYSLFDLSFVNTEIGWAVGGDLYQTRRTGVIIHTEDGGQTWEKQLEIHSPSYFSSKLFRAVSFIDEENGWTLASDYVDNFSSTYIYRTNDGGQQWNTVGTASTPLWSMSMIPNDTIWGGGFVFGKSNNGGLNWYYRGGNLDFGIVQDVEALDGNNGWVLAKSLLFTEDGMQTWTDMLPDPSLSLRAITNVGETHLWAVGDSGIVIIYTSGEPNNQIPEKFNLRQNYPNPFNTETTIRYTVAQKSQQVKLVIYDILGRIAKNLVDEAKPVGTYEVRWDGRTDRGQNVGSGTYLYKITIGEFSQTRKMVLLR
jgi:photosystem II stability/assembly factor-like uncharacterized protein